MQLLESCKLLPTCEPTIRVYTKLVSSSGCNMKSYILNYSRVFRQKKIIKCVLVSGKQMSSTPLSHSNLIFTICQIKAQTHSNTGGIHEPTGVRIYKLKNKLKAHC